MILDTYQQLKLCFRTSATYGGAKIRKSNDHEGGSDFRRSGQSIGMTNFCPLP